jgi:hypothetical protein
METSDNRYVHLPKVLVEKLIELPESGMGYQRVALTLSDGRVLRNRIVLNAQLLQLNDGEIIPETELVGVQLEL